MKAEAWNRKPSERPFLSETDLNGLTLLKSPLLQAVPGLVHAFTTREGGVSEGHLATMNLSTKLEPETPERVFENFRRLTGALGIEAREMVLTSQTHTDNIRIVAAADAGKGITRERDYDDVDGLITNVPGLYPMAFSADCVTVLLADPKTRAVGAIHAGWRGTVAGITGKAVRLLTAHFGARPEDLIVAIGPSICADCYEVGSEVAEAFQAAFGPRAAEIVRAKAPATSVDSALAADKFTVDLWTANRILLEDAGVLPAHIDVTDICTACNAGRLFSHRASGGKRGLLGSIIGFREA